MTPLEVRTYLTTAWASGTRPNTAAHHLGTKVGAITLFYSCMWIDNRDCRWLAESICAQISRHTKGTP